MAAKPPRYRLPGDARQPGRGEAESPERALFERPNGSENIALSDRERAEGFLPSVSSSFIPIIR